MVISMKPRVFEWAWIIKYVFDNTLCAANTLPISASRPAAHTGGGVIVGYVQKAGLVDVLEKNSHEGVLVLK